MVVTEIFPLNEGVLDPGLFKAVFMAGPPGAGKNYVIEKLGLYHMGLKLQDIDHALAAVHKVDPSSANYDRSLEVITKRQSVLQRGMLGMVINTTGRDVSSLMRLRRELKAAGYQSCMVFVDVDEFIAIDRVHDRKNTSTSPFDAKREVTMDYFNLAYPGARKQIEFYQYMFGDDFSMVTNNVLKPDRPGYIELDQIEHTKVFNSTMATAHKMVSSFMRRPITKLAQEKINDAASHRKNRRSQ